VGESQANGRVEEAGKTIRELVKVYKDQVEDGIGEVLETDSVLMQWMIRWAAMAYSRFQQGADGKTAYQRQTGRACRSHVVPFGESVLYKQLKRSGEKKNALDVNWHAGLWLGHVGGSSEVLIGTREGVARGWAVKRRSDGASGMQH
jgi:hypothetical protein